MKKHFLIFLILIIGCSNSNEEATTVQDTTTTVQDTTTTVQDTTSEVDDCSKKTSPDKCHYVAVGYDKPQNEFAQEIVQIAQMQQMAQQNPQVAEQLKAMMQRLEARKAVLIAEMMEEFLKEERAVTSGFGNDPIAKLRARELDLRAMDNERKKREGQEKINLDRMKAMMNQQDKQDKLDQNADLAKLRADTSIEKTILSKSIPNVDKMMPSVEIEKYEGENR